MLACLSDCITHSSQTYNDIIPEANNQNLLQSLSSSYHTRHYSNLNLRFAQLGFACWTNLSGREQSVRTIDYRGSIPVDRPTLSMTEQTWSLKWGFILAAKYV